MFDEETTITPSAPTTPSLPPSVGSTPSPATEPEAKETEEKKPTKYVVLWGESEDGPWNKLGEYAGHGQTAAKKEAIAEITEKGTKASNYWFLAVPASSYVPEKPSVKVTTVVSF